MNNLQKNLKYKIYFKLKEGLINIKDKIKQIIKYMY